MVWEWKQPDLGALGFAGICRETYRVLLRVIPPNTKGGLGAAILTVLLLAYSAVLHVYTYRLFTDRGSIVIRFGAGILFGSIGMLVLLLLSLICTALYVFRVTSFYCTDGGFDTSEPILRDLSRAPLALVFPMLMRIFPFVMLYLLLVLISCFVLLHLVVFGKVVLMPVEWMAFATFVSVVSHIACVVAVHEEGAVLFAALRKSYNLLAATFWAAAAVFVPLDGLFLALHISFIALVLDDALGLGLAFQMAAGVAIAVAMWGVLVVTLVAQPVVYLVCKNHHRDVIVRVHHIGEPRE